MIWLYIILLIIGPYIFTFIIELIKGESFIDKIKEQKENEKKMIDINTKVITGEKLNTDELILFNEQVQNNNIIDDLYKHRRNIPYNGFESEFFGVEKQILKKIVYFSVYTEDFDYVLVYGKKTASNLTTIDILILQQMFMEICLEKKRYVSWVFDLNSFVSEVKDAISWAGQKQSNLIFKHKPSDKSEDCYIKYRFSKLNYTNAAKDKNNTDQLYYDMQIAFRNLYNSLLL